MVVKTADREEKLKGASMYSIRIRAHTEEGWIAGGVDSLQDALECFLLPGIYLGMGCCKFGRWGDIKGWKRRGVDADTADRNGSLTGTPAPAISTISALASNPDPVRTRYVSEMYGLSRLLIGHDCQTMISTLILGWSGDNWHFLVRLCHPPAE